MIETKLLYLVIVPGGYVCFTDIVVAKRYAESHRGSVTTVTLDPPQPGCWYVEFCLGESGITYVTANPGPTPSQGLDKLKALNKGLWYCYVMAVDGDEAKRKAKEILNNSFSWE